MQIQSIQNQQSFKGKVSADGLNRKQQKVYDKIEPVVTDMLKDKDFDLITIASSSPKKENGFSKKLKTFINKIFSPNRKSENINRPTPENHAEMEKQAFAEIIQRMQAGEKGPFKIDYYYGQKPKIHNLSNKK